MASYSANWTSFKRSCRQDSATKRGGLLTKTKRTQVKEQKGNSKGKNGSSISANPSGLGIPLYTKSTHRSSNVQCFVPVHSMYSMNNIGNLIHMCESARRFLNVSGQAALYERWIFVFCHALCSISICNILCFFEILPFITYHITVFEVTSTIRKWN